MEVNNQIIEIIKDKLMVDEISSNDNLVVNLHADSLDIIELVMELEHTFDITILDEEVDPNFTNVGHLIDFIQTKVNKRKGQRN